MQSNYFLSSGERKGISSNRAHNVLCARGCRIIAFRKEEELQNFLVVESCWEAEPEQVKAL